MSYMKRMLEEEEHKRDIIEKITVDTGVLKKCKNHDFLYRGEAEIQDAYKLGNALWSDITIAETFESLEEIKKLIRIVVEGHPENQCSLCAKIRKE
jgi:hypothetical protein